MNTNCGEAGKTVLETNHLFAFGPYLAILAVAAATLGIADRALADQSPGGCNQNGSGAAIGFVAAEGATTIKHGDEICFQVQIFNTCNGCCDVTELDAELILPNGTPVPIAVDASVLAGDQMFCPGDPRCATASTCTIPGPTACDGAPCVGYRYIINHPDEHGQTGTNCPPTPQSGFGQVSAFLRSTGGTVHMQIHVGANLCKAIAADIPHACCEPCTGTCTDVLSPSECPFPSVLTQDKNCDELSPPCSPLNCAPFITKCNDSRCNPSTGVCTAVPIAGCCTGDAQCPADTKCVDSFCDHATADPFDNFCNTRPVVGCCTGDGDCPADVKCIDSFCNHATSNPLDNFCDTRLIIGCCDADSDCPADTKCVDSFCDHATADPFDNFCNTRPIQGCCTGDADCPADTKCVDSFCNHADAANLFDNFCDTRLIIGCCDADSDCPADTKCVDSFCNPANPDNLFDNFCDTRIIVGCCDADSDCPADTKCVDSFCNHATADPFDNFCDTRPIVGCCTSDTQCPGDTKCVDSFCNHATADPFDNFCDTRPIVGCCDADNDCPADTKCVDSFCNHATADPFDNFCDTRLIIGCCDADNDCPADTKCVDSFCNHATSDLFDNFCDTRVILGCCTGDAQCPADTKCVDSFCNHATSNPLDNFCDTRQILGCCDADNDCPADTKCVDSFCNHATSSPLDNFCDTRPIVGCCDADNDCPADSLCVDRFCNHATSDPLDNFCDTRPIVPCCGDNAVNAPEICDGSAGGTLGCSAAGSGGLDACRTNCTCCGDGHLDAGETCDDGNDVNDDACTNSCTPGSPCDDGNACTEDLCVCDKGHDDDDDDGDDDDGDDDDGDDDDHDSAVTADGTGDVDDGDDDDGDDDDCDDDDDNVTATGDEDDCDDDDDGGEVQVCLCPPQTLCDDDDGDDDDGDDDDHDSVVAKDTDGDGDDDDGDDDDGDGHEPSCKCVHRPICNAACCPNCDDGDPCTIDTCVLGSGDHDGDDDDGDDDDGDDDDHDSAVTADGSGDNDDGDDDDGDDDDGDDGQGQVCVCRHTNTCVCGDNAINRPGETCDGTAFPPGTPPGTTCRANCTFCGDGIRQARSGEECDGLDVGSVAKDDDRDDCSRGCDSNCQCLGCGDARECTTNSDCEDKNRCTRDTCVAGCCVNTAIVPCCGDGVVQGSETCDPPGSDTDSGNKCRSSCTYCGDDRKNGSEECDGSDSGKCDMTAAGHPAACTDDCECAARDEGCSPGYWKNHASVWDGLGANDKTATIKTTTRFNTVFGVNGSRSGVADCMTLLAALDLPNVKASCGKVGSPSNEKLALDRHAAAALANADTDIDYPFTVAEVIAMYRDAVSAVSGPETISSAKAKLSEANNLGCPF